MHLLALETSTEHCSVALWRSGLVDDCEVPAGQRHSAVLLDMVDRLLVAHGLTTQHLDGIAFGAGPGSFTGLRIACGVAQGIGFGASIPVLGVSTLLAMAELTDMPRVLCCLDARMGQLYFAVYRKCAGCWHTVLAPGLAVPAKLPELPGSDAWVGCGSGFASHGEAIMQRNAGRLSGVVPEIRPHARAIVRLAAPEFARGGGVAAQDAQPVYIRDKVALKTDER